MQAFFGITEFFYPTHSKYLVVSKIVSIFAEQKQRKTLS